MYVFQKVVPKVVCYKCEKLDQAETAFSICRVILTHFFFKMYYKIKGTVKVLGRTFIVRTANYKKQLATPLNLKQ